MSGILAEERERSINLKLELEEAQKSQVLPEETENLTMFNGRPTLEALLQNEDTMVTISKSYLIELVAVFENRAGSTVAEYINSRKRHRETDLANDQLRVENVNLRNKITDVLEENTLAYKEIDELKEKQGAVDLSIIKLPLKKVNTFLKFCRPEEENDENSIFFVKMENGLMTRITRTEEELKIK